MAINNAYAGKFSKSVRLLERIMRYNSDDNQGARYMLGDLYFLQNSFQKAEEIYKNNLDYPPYLYSLGLLEFSLGNRVKAISFLRKGILENIYISDHLRMKGPLIPYEIWHGTNFERPETAYSYLDLMIQKWVQYPEAVELLQFLHLAEPSNFEIQNTYMLKNELYFADNSFGDEQTNSLRNEIINDIENVKKGINQTSSKEILKRWQNNTLQETFREQ